MAVPLDLSALPGADGQPRRRRRRQSQAIGQPAPVDNPVAGGESPETEGILKSIGRKALSGLSVVGNVLDLPGSSVRDLLAGENPFDQWINPTTGENRVSGRDLLTRYGLTSQNQETGFDYANPGELGQDLLGFGAEILLDPLAPLSLGAKALGKGGRVAKSAGLMDDAVEVASRAAGKAVGPRTARMTTSLGDLLAHNPAGVEDAARAAHAQGLRLRDIAGDPLGGLVGVGMPLGREPKAVFGNLKAAELLDRAGAGIRESAPVRTLAGLFGGSRKGTSTIVGQRLAEKVTKQATKAESTAAGEAARSVQEIRDSGFFDQFPNQDLAHDALFEYLEGINQPPTEISGAVERLRGHMRDVLARAEAVGLKTKNLQDDFIEYAPRKKLNSKGDSLERNRTLKAFGVSDPAANRRADLLRNLPGGTSSIRKLAREAAPIIEQMNATAGITQKAARQGLGDWINQTFGQAIPDTYTVMKKGQPVAVDGRHKQLAGWLLGQPIEDLKRGLFTDAISSAQGRMNRGIDAAGVADSVLDTLADRPLMKKASAKSKTQPVRVRDLLKGLGFEVSTRAQRSGLHALAEKMGIASPDVATLKKIGKGMVPGDLAADMMLVQRGFSGPEIAGKVGSVLKSFNSLFKSGVTSAFPSFNSRNFVSGLTRNYLGGMGSRRSIYDAYKLMKGKAIKGAAEIPVVRDALLERGLPLTDEAGTKIIGELSYAHRMTGRRAGQGISESQGGYLADIGQAMQEVPGTVPMSPMRDYLRGLTFRDGASFNPLNVRGVGKRQETTFGPARGGQAIAEGTEQIVRNSAFIHQLRRGVSPDEAARNVLAGHFDYDAKSFSPFENTYAKTAFPFWAFASRNLPYTVRQLLEEPGGLTAQGVRAANDSADQSPMTPPHVAQNLAIPLGTLPDGSRRYFSGLGLAEEAALQYGNVLGGSLQDPLREIGAQMSPLFKMPAEWAFGETLHQAGASGGRDINDLDPLIGRIAANAIGREQPFKLPAPVEYLAANSPASRLLSTTRSILDPRKGPGTKLLNNLTGAKITDVSPQAQTAVLKDAVEAILRDEGAARTFEGVYKTGDDLTPEQAAMFELLAEIRRKTRGRRRTSG